jgi:hypothetical protein
MQTQTVSVTDVNRSLKRFLQSINDLGVNDPVDMQPSYDRHSFFATLLFANFSCHLLTFGGALASPSCKINSIVSSIFEMAVTEARGIGSAASSDSARVVVEGRRIMIGFEVFFCLI